eukprot:Hpha_TRINITY_DN3542_c0_g1::TRINITY_DN3542_c0_g1_i1::g.25657::m.25657
MSAAAKARREREQRRDQIRRKDAQVCLAGWARRLACKGEAAGRLRAVVDGEIDAVCRACGAASRGAALTVARVKPQSVGVLPPRGVWRMCVAAVLLRRQGQWRKGKAGEGDAQREAWLVAALNAAVKRPDSTPLKLAAQSDAAGKERWIQTFVDIIELIAAGAFGVWRVAEDRGGVPPAERVALTVSMSVMAELGGTPKAWAIAAKDGDAVAVLGAFRAVRRGVGRQLALLASDMLALPA